MLSKGARTQGSFRNRVTPRYVYDERWHDLCICVQLDGYILGDDKLIRAEPKLEGTFALEDDLTRELDRAALRRRMTYGELLRIQRTISDGQILT